MHLLLQGLLDHPITHHQLETPTTMTEIMMTTLTFHYLGAQVAFLNVRPPLPTTLTLLTTCLEDLHGFRSQGLLEGPELPTILTVTADHLEGHLEDRLEDRLEDHLEDRPILVDHLLGLRTTHGYRTHIHLHHRQPMNGHHDP